MRSVRPSPIINAYLLLTLPLDFAQVRTLWIRGSYSSIATVFSCIASIKTVLLISEAVEKRRILLPPWKNYSPESTSGLYSRGVFWWLNPLFLLGYKEVLSNDTLLAIDEKLMSKPVQSRFQREWVGCTVLHPHDHDSYLQSIGKINVGKYALLHATARAMIFPLATAVVPRLCLIFFRYMQPLLIHRVSTFVAQPVTGYSMNQGWGLTGAYGLVYLGLALSQAIYYHQVYRMITMVRSALVTTIYGKTVELSTIALDESAAVTLMSTDVERICDSLAQLHEIWASIIEIALGIWLLTNQIGLALLGPLTVMILAVISNMAVSKRMGPAQKSWMEAIQSRIDVTSKMLESMKGVKMLGLTPSMSSIILGLRKHEITLSLKSRKLLASCITLANSSHTIAPGVALIIYVIVNRDSDETLGVSQAFTTLSLISLLSYPVATLIFAVPPLMGSLGCLERIQSFLLSKTREDHRIVLGSGRDKQQSHLASDPALNQDIELHAMMSTANPDSASIRVINASFAWGSDTLPVVKDVCFELTRGSFTWVVGPVGCGKSSMLKGILGEIPSGKGFVHVDSPYTAFVQQDRWVQHKSFRNNVLGTAVFNRTWYDTVIHACSLNEDIAQLTRGDLTLVGSAGHSLSGGQKHRLVSLRSSYF